MPLEVLRHVTDRSLAVFMEHARSAAAGDSARVVPVWRESLIDTDTPVSAFAKLRRGNFGFLLESAPAGGETWARYTFMGTEPDSAWRYAGGRVSDWSPSKGWHNEREIDDPLADLDQKIARRSVLDLPELGNFWSGAVGFFGYDIVRLIENLPNRPRPTSDRPPLSRHLTRNYSRQTAA